MQLKTVRAQDAARAWHNVATAAQLALGTRHSLAPATLWRALMLLRLFCTTGALQRVERGRLAEDCSGRFPYGGILPCAIAGVTTQISEDCYELYKRLCILRTGCDQIVTGERCGGGWAKEFVERDCLWSYVLDTSRYTQFKGS